jgi:hypothetical protein
MHELSLAEHRWSSEQLLFGHRLKESLVIVRGLVFVHCVNVGVSEQIISVATLNVFAEHIRYDDRLGSIEREEERLKIR